MRRYIYFLSVLYASWLGMMAIHESGHALAAWITGGHVQGIVLPLWGFSRTDVSPNPNQLAVVWAGPIWGSMVPPALWVAFRKSWKVWRFFCGFCLIANGSYLAVGWSMHAGDAWELVQLGVARCTLIIVGSIWVAAGLWIWHRLGRRKPPMTPAGV